MFTAIGLIMTMLTSEVAYPIIPHPATLEPRPGAFALKSDTPLIATSADAQPVAAYLSEQLAGEFGLKLDVQTAPDAPARAIVLTLDTNLTAGDEAYVLDISRETARLSAPHPHGLIHGVQTIRQLLAKDDGNWRLPACHIEDQPHYRWRGMLLDCGRHFMPKEFVKRYIDLLAYHKMNVLHWHLTEDQGWRIEIKKYPKLTEIGAWRDATRDSEQPRDGQRYGGFYTQDDVREIVAYAASRHITIVPEIEMPGHSVAALAAYPELSCTGEPLEVMTQWGIHRDVYCAGNEQVFEFLEDVLTEVMELFPSEYIHVGGDESPKDRWKTCPKCQARIKAEGLADEHELQSYFIRRMEKFLSAHGRRLVGWDEILEGGLAPGATVQSWRGMKGAIAAAQAGHDVISSPTSNCYLDYAQADAPGEPVRMGRLSLEQCYAFEPTPASFTPDQAKHVLGLEGNMWTEHAPPSRVDWQVFPRLCALAEVAWSPEATRDWENFQTRLQTHYRRLDALGVAYFIPQPTCLPAETDFTDTVDVVLESPVNHGSLRYTVDGSEPTDKSSIYERPVSLNKSATIKARVFLEDGRAGLTGEWSYKRK